MSAVVFVAFGKSVTTESSEATLFASQNSSSLGKARKKLVDCSWSRWCWSLCFLYVLVRSDWQQSVSQILNRLFERKGMKQGEDKERK